MGRKIRVIPATIDRYTASPIDKPRLRRVAAYARVSTDLTEQLTSYAAQIDYYTKYIQNHEGWEFVKIYADEGITGTSTKNRDEFNEMVRDALDGKIDLIIAKSVSRFARNTVDSLSTIRKLREHNVECYFEKENVYTFDPKGDLLLTFMSGLAQEESRNISENTTWGHRKRFADGDVTFAYSRFLGYDKGADGKIVINEKQAVIVRRIYQMYMQGYTFTGIAKKLTEDGIPTVTGKTRWSESSIRSILTNEKYKGDALLQKSYTVDFLSKKVKKNSGEVQQYYIVGNHDAIIPPETFDSVQRLIESGANSKKRKSSTRIFSGRVLCGDCGSALGSKIWHSNDKYRRVVWQCNSKFKNKKKCSTPHFKETELQEAFIRAVNKLLPKRDTLRSDFKNHPERFDTTELQGKLLALKDELNMTVDKMDECVERNARVALDQNEVNTKYSKLENRYNSLKKKADSVEDEIANKQVSKSRTIDFLNTLDELPAEITAFDEQLFVTLTDHIRIYTKDDIRVTFANGTEIKA